MIMPQFLYVLRPTRLEMLTDGGTPDEERIVGEHFAHLQHLTEQGVAILLGRTLNNDERTMGIVIFNADDDAAAHAIMESDPAVVNGVMTAELFPYRVALIREANARQ
jgi:uncharacterized protein YciI